MKKIIIDTDLGHDPDDFFAICYLAAIGVKIDAIVLNPGDLDQIAFANFLVNKLELDCAIGVSKLDREKCSSGGMYYDLLKGFGYHGSWEKWKNRHDGLGTDVLYQTYDGSQDILVIGPATNTAGFIGKSNLDNFKTNIVMQGGFLPYSKNPYHIPLVDKFIDVESMGTFNLNGDKKAGQKIVETRFNSKRFVGKHICHTIKLDKSKKFEKKNLASTWFDIGLKTLFEYTDSKKFHDPLAAVCCYYPEIFDFVKGYPHHVKGGWTSIIDESSNCEVAARVNEDKFWELLTSFKQVENA